MDIDYENNYYSHPYFGMERYGESTYSGCMNKEDVEEMKNWKEFLNQPHIMFVLQAPKPTKPRKEKRYSCPGEDVFIYPEMRTIRNRSGGTMVNSRTYYQNKILHRIDQQFSGGRQEIIDMIRQERDNPNQSSIFKASYDMLATWVTNYVTAIYTQDQQTYVTLWNEYEVKLQKLLLKIRNWRNEKEREQENRNRNWRARQKIDIFSLLWRFD